ncbi:transcriptional regulator GcvA [Pontivivens insulae]|uniref:Glycine cleavage system transcriptional activator n=1 Tax=Pontivivens insulae TaxID=1639689 RepID=A0A2R8A9A5_9RHOB|nr:transcriptional regulator GcvA [Pontivivens insulae]RED12712.1 LysR family transcriptional regulator [Pontivivens insulae]SPF28803.1 Glycine cleavage system transcriptional activator [Pontivivens insulae]
MSDRLPPLTALRAFEAASRHMSFRDAADELAVTPAALSYQIKSLEEHLGVPLFRRLNRAVELTEEGRVLAPGTRDAFDQLRASWRATQRLAEDTTLTITAGPGFTAKWLAPRMFDFAQMNPEIDMRVSASLKIMDFMRDEIDVAIRFGTSSDEGLHSVHLLDEWLSPVMTPSLAEQINEPRDLLDLMLIHDESLNFLSAPPGWRAWFKHAGVEVPETLHGHRFSQADHAIDMALEGTGVVLGRSSLCDRYLLSGRLVTPFRLALTIPAHYRLICPLGQQGRPAIATFTEWIKAEIAQTAQLAEDRDLVPV